MTTPDIAKAFGEIVRAKRERQAISEEGLGNLANLDRTYMSGLERALRNPTLGTMEKIAHALGTTIAKLVAKAERQG